MRKIWIVGLLVFIIIVGLSYFVLGKTNVLTQPTKKTVSVPSASLPTPPEAPVPEVLPSLYADVSWRAPNTGSVTIFTGYTLTPDSSIITALGQRADKFYYIISQPLDAAKRKSIVTYYETWFGRQGWKEDIMADGPIGSEIGFIKNGNRFLINFSYLPHNTAFYTVTIEHN